MNKKLLVFIKAIGDPTRLRILNHLKKECCVGDLWQKLNLPQNLCSHHLRVLKEAKLITSKKMGLKVVYKLNEEFLESNLKELKNYLN
ncbi:MAG: metalloregulator ArsR/SmtB family transcription factor [Candidatus Falkowbacteria bacterium]|nr:metalloregulator ArsR/SmtB family transcription factor [Candidatus Falkowbacteria bacterium]